MNTKQRKLVITLIAALLVALMLPCTVFAAELARVPAGRRLPRFVDDVGLLSYNEATVLTARLDEVSERHMFDVVVVVVDSIGRRDPRVYAADFYEQNGYGLDGDSEGIILLLAMEYRDFAFATTDGYGSWAFTDAGQEYLERLFLPYLRENDFFEAFMAFADGADDFLIRAEEGRPYDRGNIPLLTGSQKLEARIWAVVGSIVLAAIISTAVVFTWKSQLKSVRKQSQADAYIREGSMVLRAQHDIFLHSRVTKTLREKSNSSGSRSGSFSSSSGSSFSGRSGKF